MSLLVDVQTVQGGFFGNRGIRRYALGLARALVDRRRARALLLNPSRPWLEEFPPELLNVDAVCWNTRRQLRELDGEGAHAYLMTSPFERTTPVDAALPSYVVDSGMPVVAVLYDLIPEIVDVYPADLMPDYWARREIVKGCDLLLTLSSHVRDAAIERLDVPPARVSVIGAAASDFFGPTRPGERPDELLVGSVPRLTRPFVLSVTGWSKHKNVEGLIEAWSRLGPYVRRRFQLVLTCPLPPGGEGAWTQLATGLGLAPDDVVVTGRVDDQVVRALYQRAELFVLPSFEEGFGLPVLEAVRCGCPAITSNTSSLPEVLELEASTFSPHDIDGVAETIEHGLMDPLFRADLRAAGDAAVERHTWDRVSERAAQACSSVQAARPRRGPAPIRVALVGSCIPSTPSVASAIARLCEILRERGTIDVFDTASPRVDAEQVLGETRDAWGYDAVVYLVDGDLPARLRELARSYPGVMWFVEAPTDLVAARDLARTAQLVVRSAHGSALAIDPGPWGRAVPSRSVAQERLTDADEVLELLNLSTLATTGRVR